MSLPEVVLKRRAKRVRQDADEAARRIAVKQAKRNPGRLPFKHAAAFVKEFKQQEVQDVRLRRLARDRAQTRAVPEGVSLMCVVRVCGVNNMHPKSRKVMQQLRLRHMNELVFLSVSPATMSMVRMVDPFVAYGYPTLKTVRDLIYKRGHGKVSRQRVPLTDNAVIEEALGAHGIICMEDLVHEIYTVGPHFKEASAFLWPIKLNGATEKGGAKKRKAKTPTDNKEQTGNQEAKINELIKKMN